MALLKTEVRHSQTKSAWNVVSTVIGSKYKIARIPYNTGVSEECDKRERMEALEYAKFISKCLNNMDNIITDQRW